MNRQEKRRLQREEEKRKRLEISSQNSNKSMVRFICLQCNIEVAQQDLFGRLRKDNLVNAIDI